MFRIIGLFIEVQYILHTPDEIACYLSYAPLLPLPWLGFIFFKILLTLIAEIEGTSFNSTSLSAKSWRVHFDLPDGGSEQARDVSFAFARPLIFEGAPLRGFSFNIDSRPSWQYFFLNRATVDLLVSNASTISESERPASARSNILARVWLLDDDFPLRR
jgi:hypothetical protein